MRTAEAMSQPPSCVLTPRRTLGKPYVRTPGRRPQGAMSRGRRSSAAPPCPSVVFDVGRRATCACPTAESSDVHRPSVMSQPWDLGMSGYRTATPCPSAHLDVTTSRPVGGHRRAGDGAHRCHPPWTSRRPPVSGRRTGYDTGVRHGAWDATPVFARRPLGPGPGSDLRRGRRVAARPVVPAAAAPDQGCPVVMPRVGRVVADRVTQQRPIGR